MRLHAPLFLPFLAKLRFDEVHLDSAGILKHTIPNLVVQDIFIYILSCFPQNTIRATFPPTLNG